MHKYLKKIQIFFFHFLHEKCSIYSDIFFKKGDTLWRNSPSQKHAYQVSNLDKIFPFWAYVLLPMPVKKSFNHVTCTKQGPFKKRDKMDHKYTRLNLLIFP